MWRCVRRPAVSPTWCRTSNAIRCRKPPWASATPVGPPTACRTTPTRIRTPRVTAKWPSSTTASSKTRPSCVSTCRRKATISFPKPIRRSRRSCWARSATRSSKRPASLTCSRPSAVSHACWKARSPSSPPMCASRTSWSAPVTIRRWWSVLAKARTSSAPTWPRSWPTPSAPWKSTRTRP